MLQGLVAPFRVVLQRSLSDWLIVAATWLVIVCATTLIAIGVLYGDAVALTGLRRIVADEPATATSITVQTRASADELPDVETRIERQVSRILGWTGGELNTVARSESYALPGTDGTDADALTPLAIFGSYEKIERHAMLLEGAWPDAGADPMEIAVSRAAADALGLELGAELSLTSQRGSDRVIGVRVIGVWQPNDPTNAYWRGDALELNGVSTSASFATHGPLVVAREDLLGRTASGDVALELRALPDFDRLAVDNVDWMRSDTAALERRLRDALGSRDSFQISTELDTILADANRSLLVSRSGVVVLTIQFAVLAGYALLLVAGLLVEQRRIETALLRSRGAGVGHLALLSFLEALLLVGPAIVAAPFLAVSVLELLNVGGPLAEAGIRIEPRVDTAVVLAAAGAGLAAIVGLVLPALGAGRGLAAVRQTLSRQGNRSLAQRLGIDIALVVLAGVGLWQLRQYGAPLTQTVRGSVGLDPLLVAAPAIGLLAGSILALRIVPLAAELAERVLSGRRGLVGPLGARQLSRRPLRYTRSALLLMLAAALGTFAGAYASTWTRSQDDQATYRTGSDVRVTVAGFPDLPGWAIGQAYRGVEGVEEALPVARARFDIEDSGGGTIIAVDTTDAAGVVTMRPDLADAPLDRLLADLRQRGETAPGVQVQAEPDRFRVTVTTALEPLIVSEETSVGFSPGFRGVTPAVVLRDADGVVRHVTGPRLAVGLGEQTIEIALTEALDAGPILRPAAPFEILGVELQMELPEGALGVGSVSLDALHAVSGEASQPIDVSAAGEFTAGAANAVQGFGSASTTAIDFSLADGLADPGPIPALASTSYLEATGAAVGDTIELGQLAERRQFEIVGQLRGFPTVEPGDPFIVTDLAALAAWDEARGVTLEIDEWWLRTADGAGPDVAVALRADPYSAATVTSRHDLHRDLLSDPVALGVIGALALGAASAIVFAAIGFIVSATVSTRERLGEFALLQAIGLSHRQLSAWLTLENAFLLFIGLLAGTGLGLLLAWVVLPFVTLTQEAAVAVPPVEVVIPWGIYGLLYLVALVALVVTVIVIGRLLARVRVSGVLRSGGE